MTNILCEHVPAQLSPNYCWRLARWSRCLTTRFTVRDTVRHREVKFFHAGRNTAEAEKWNQLGFTAKRASLPTFVCRSCGSCTRIGFCHPLLTTPMPSSSGSPRRLQQKRANVSMRAHDGTQLHCVHASGIHSGTSSARPRFWNSDCQIGVSPPGLKELTSSASPDLVFRLFKNTSENSSGDLEYYVREGFAFFSDTSVSNAEPHDSGYSTLYRF